MMHTERITFAGLTPVELTSDLRADVVIIGIPHGVPYHTGEISPSHDAPEIIRAESLRYPEDVNSWDFDLGNTLLADSSLMVVDAGDLDGDPRDPAGNHKRGIRAIREILKCGALPVVLGGDDSIPLMAFKAFEGFREIQILQIDAHIDWRDEFNGIPDGFSSPMRRASELPWVKKIIQVGARGTGTARRQEYETARAFGADIITAYELHRHGLKYALEAVQADLPCYVTIDCDGLDPACMPAVMSPIPGGITYFQMFDLLRSVQDKAGLAGLNLVEYVPRKDVNNLGAVTAMRIIWFFVGLIAQQKMT